MRRCRLDDADRDGSGPRSVGPLSTTMRPVLDQAPTQCARRQPVLLARDCGGVAAIEFAVFAGLLSLAILNVTDVSIYAFQLMEVENATQMAAQAAWTT